MNLPRDYPWAGSTAVANTRAWRAAEIPAVNGHGNARSIAEIHCILANGGVAKGKRFMSEAGCRKALEQQIEGPDLVMSHMPPARFGMGFALPGPLLELDLPNPNTIHWGGGGRHFRNPTRARPGRISPPTSRPTPSPMPKRRPAGSCSLTARAPTAGTRYNGKNVPNQWKVVHGVLLVNPHAGKEDGDIVTDDQYRDFELALEWKISAGWQQRRHVSRRGRSA